VPTSNFFNKEGYEDNPVAIKYDTVSKVLAATNMIMDKQAKLQGAKELAAAFP
jgi:hypothetical protein